MAEYLSKLFNLCSNVCEFQSLGAMDNPDRLSYLQNQYIICMIWFSVHWVCSTAWLQVAVSHSSVPIFLCFVFYTFSYPKLNYPSFISLFWLLNILYSTLIAILR